MKIVYVDGGPDTIRMGETRFWKGVPQDVPDELAKAILQKQTVHFEEVKEERSDRSDGSD